MRFSPRCWRLDKMMSRSWSMLFRVHKYTPISWGEFNSQGVMSVPRTQGRLQVLHARFSRPLLFSLLVGMALVANTGARSEILTNAKHALLLDYDSGEVVFCKSCAEPMPPSSMSKLMTVELLFQRLKDGRLKPEDTFHVSETAWRQGQKDNESKMWVALNSDISIDNLLKGIIIQSGGDACVVVAKSLGGSE